MRKRLLAGDGRVSGKITYGEIEIERGGRISGEISHEGEAAFVASEAGTGSVRGTSVGRKVSPLTWPARLSRHVDARWSAELATGGKGVSL